MCGIVGYIGNKNAILVGLDGLKRLEYRGYDSAGMAAINDAGKVFYEKLAGRVANLEQKVNEKNIDSHLAIFHTRWATHGKPTGKNAHPHWDCKKEIFVVHNGIIENHKVLKEKLEKEGHKFISETDTEVLSHLIEKFFRGNLEEAVRRALKLVSGTYGLAVISNKDQNKIVIAQMAPSVRASIGEEFGLAVGTDLTGQIYTAFRKLGFDKIFAANFMDGSSSGFGYVSSDFFACLRLAAFG